METLRKTRPRNTLKRTRDPWMSIRSAARDLGMSQVKALTMLARKEFGRHIIINDHIYVRRERVERLIRDRMGEALTGT